RRAAPDRDVPLSRAARRERARCSAHRREPPRAPMKAGVGAAPGRRSAIRDTRAGPRASLTKPEITARGRGSASLFFETPRAALPIVAQLAIIKMLKARALVRPRALSFLRVAALSVVAVSACSIDARGL